MSAALTNTRPWGCKLPPSRVGGWLWFNTDVSSGERVAVYAAAGLSLQQCIKAVPGISYATAYAAWRVAFHSRRRGRGTTPRNSRLVARGSA